MQWRGLDASVLGDPARQHLWIEMVGMRMGLKEVRDAGRRLAIHGARGHEVGPHVDHHVIIDHDRRPLPTIPSTPFAGFLAGRAPAEGQRMRWSGARSQKRDLHRVILAIHADEYGGAGIRTRDQSFSPDIGLANRRLRPLGHPSL